LGVCAPQDEDMSRLLLVSAMVVSMTAMAFFNIPQQMFQTGSQMMFPAQDKQEPICECKCVTAQ